MGVEEDPVDSLRLYKGANIREGYTVALDPNRRTRDYLYGRLLAYADSIERWALSERNEQRPTNASSLNAAFRRTSLFNVADIGAFNPTIYRPLGCQRRLT